ncbi:MAG: type II toxin-antitoxin system VapC family toxin [Anaerolineae bacterium]
MALSKQLPVPDQLRLIAELSLRVRQALAGTEPVDTNPFIYLFERNPRYFALAEELFSYLKQPTVMGVTSIITLIETCVQPQREARLDLVETYERALLNSQQVQMLAIDPVLARSLFKVFSSEHQR